MSLNRTETVCYPIPPAPDGYFQSAQWMRDEIAGLEGDIEGWQETIDTNRTEIPRMELETLKKQLEIAQAQIRIHELKAKLTAKESL